MDQNRIKVRSPNKKSSYFIWYTVASIQEKVRFPSNNTYTFCAGISAPRSISKTILLCKIFKEDKLLSEYWVPKFWFGNNVKQLLGATTLNLKTPARILPVTVKCDAVNVDIHFFLRLGVPDIHSLVADSVENQMSKKAINEQTATRTPYEIND